MEKVDYLVVGQGIAGSLLAYELLNAGASVMVLNKETEESSSMKAAGIYNPITGRRMIKTWMADELFSGLEAYYSQLEQVLNARFLYPKSIYRPFFSHEEQNDWAGRLADDAYTPYLKQIHPGSRQIPGVLDDFGGLELKKCGFVHLPNMLKAMRKWFDDKGMYRSEVFQYEEMNVSEGEVKYKELRATKVVFCEGPAVAANPYWNSLPFKPVKGEILEIATNLPENEILNRGVFVLPKNGKYSVGSTYDHDHLDYKPTAKGINNLKGRLKKIYEGDYQEVGATAGVRPATYDRKPFLGWHPEFPSVGIFNGFGTKGVSLIPFFACHMVNYCLRDAELLPEVAVSRTYE
ncbi:NAD(P)/FAD-dependent oxidoreductase [Marinoscillum furvescens]|uniref:Glycine/D-amino acid oxidase-like deaminating enzyme n=1 Tax=Marinoscillum furvescens DSM 4134 TaxID=1122208 RepID=A0A3D9L384_MARFU|nr:FAD-dependent oxidoreductase [Marinoscillum furvescens]RED99744.1 glycine/D-amino acid oxidase-like deaminating enzyme [Marinoscillum furvescens DSM 4134]